MRKLTSSSVIVPSKSHCTASFIRRHHYFLIFGAFSNISDSTDEVKPSGLEKGYPGARIHNGGNEIGPLLHKYLVGVEGVSTENRVRIFRLIEKLAFESRDIVSNIHGGGSPETHRMTILRNANIEVKKKLAKNLAGIKE